MEICVCGHERVAHEHYRAGSDCAVCDCRRYRTLLRAYRQWRKYREIYTGLIYARLAMGYNVSEYHIKIFRLQAKRESRAWPSKN